MASSPVLKGLCRPKGSENGSWILDILSFCSRIGYGLIAFWSVFKGTTKA